VKFTPQVFIVAANRFFSILDPLVFNSVVKSFSEERKSAGYLIVGINLASSENSEKNFIKRDLFKRRMKFS
jgi:hypothetical protein